MKTRPRRTRKIKEEGKILPAAQIFFNNSKKGKK